MAKHSPHVLVDGSVYLYRDKAPFIPAGRSVLGALEYNQADDTLKCHECGVFTGMLGRHAAIRHKIPARQYKRKFGLNQSTALVSETVRTRLAEAAKMRVAQH